jgi:hypothetical protein
VIDSPPNNYQQCGCIQNNDTKGLEKEEHRLQTKWWSIGDTKWMAECYNSREMGLTYIELCCSSTTVIGVGLGSQVG